MNKICTYVGTTLCTILFFLATAHAQNNGPTQIGFNLSTIQHLPDTVNIYDIVTDIDGDRLFLNQTSMVYHAYGITTPLSDTVFVYSPYMSDCGDIGVPISVTICDTSLTYGNSICDTFYLDVNNECTWTPITSIGQIQTTDTLCNNSGMFYGANVQGGSGFYNYEWSSSVPEDVVYQNGGVEFSGTGMHYITVKVVDILSHDSIENIIVGMAYIIPNFEGYIDTDTTFSSGMRFIALQQLQPDAYAHSISWWDADTTLLQSASIDSGVAQQYVDQAMIFCPDTSGFYFISLHDFSTNCVYYAEAYYTGINHQLNGDDYGSLEFYTTTSNSTPTHIEDYRVEQFGYCVERIRFTDIILPPINGSISYNAGEMYYTPGIQCGLDTFLAIACDTSKYLPHSTCDTMMVIMNVQCQISATASLVQGISCVGANDGIVTVTVSGDVINPSDIAYYWSNGATTATITGLAPGSYWVNVTYLDLATVYASITISNPPALNTTVQVQNACGAVCNGSVVPIVTGGTPPYSYVWSNGTTLSTATNLCGNLAYTATIVDSKGCITNVSATINQNTSPITVSIAKQDIDCDSVFGSATATASNGVPPYSYIWVNAVSWPSIYQLTEGTYYVQVTDAIGCAATDSVTILNNTGLSAVIVDSLLPTCNNTADGMVRIAPTGGVVPYSYQWANNASTTNTVTGLSAGMYSVTVSDNGGCSFVYQFTLAPQNVLTVTDTVVSANCTAGDLGQISLYPQNGTAPYSYTWNTGATGVSMQGPAGTYQYTITDANGCSVNGSAAILNYSLFLSAYTQPENCGLSNGSANVIAYNGYLPFSYQWNNDPLLNNDTLSGIAAGTYTIKVTDARGCYRTASREVGADCYALLQGNLYMDENGDCIRQTGEVQTLNTYTVTARNAVDYYYATLSPNGNYTIIVRNTGTYVVELYDRPCVNICRKDTITVTGLGNNYTVQPIGIAFSNTDHDFSVSLNGTNAVPGFNTTYNISIATSNNPQQISGSVVLSYNPILTFVSATGGGVIDINAHTVTWSNINLQVLPMYSYLHAVFNVPVSATVGTLLQGMVSIGPDSNDCNQQNNSMIYTRPITSSFDPNMKVANPSTEILETDSVIHYTIHFQNTGNDTTHFVILKDTLSELVDPASFEFGGSSHQPCRYDISGTGVLTFTFDPIYLVDSATNEEASKGYVNYSIKKKGSTEIGEVIRNTAHIYFDFNPAVVTNTTENEVTTLVSIRDIKADDNLTAKVYPNPFSETATIELSEKLAGAKLVVTNLAGQVVQEYNSENGNKWQISKHGLSQGMYTFTVYSIGKPMLRGKLIAE